MLRYHRNLIASRHIELDDIADREAVLEEIRQEIEKVQEEIYNVGLRLRQRKEKHGK